MRTQKLFLAALICMLLSACKKDEGNTNMENTVSKMTTAINLHDDAAVKYKEVFLATGDKLEAIIEMAKWCLEQPSVQAVDIADDNIIYITFNNGLVTPVTVIPVDASGIHLVRGSGAGELRGFSLSKSSASDDYIIENDSVVIFIPFLDEFYAGGYPFLNKFSDGKQKLQPKLLLRQEADLAAINTFADYGLIILNTHGEFNGFEILTKISKFDDPWEPGREPFTEEEIKALIAQDNNLPLDKIENGELELSFKILAGANGSGVSIQCSEGVIVTDKYIRKLPRLNKAIVFGNHCNSGFTYHGPNENNLPEAWKSIGAITYYGYAFPDGGTAAADNNFCKEMEDSLITNLLYALDSTGIAHLKNNTTKHVEPYAKRRTGGVRVPVPGTDYSTREYTEEHPLVLMDLHLEHFHDQRYKYKPCGDTLIDSRDGQKYATVCVGDQVWMAENLNYGSGHCYEDIPANCETYGQFYYWPDATNDSASNDVPSGIRGVCPAGWHLPSDAEWDILVNNLGGVDVAGGKMKALNLWDSPNTGADNSSGFNGLPAGLLDSNQINHSLNYMSLGRTTTFLTTRKFDADEAYGRSLSYQTARCNSLYMPISRRVSVRCVKD